MRVDIERLVGRQPVVGLAVGVVGPDGLREFHGHGVADTESGAPITERTVFRIASITKTFTAVAVMQLVEAGLVDLDAPVNDYLRSYRLVPAREGLGPARVRHLLTHTAGLGEVAHLSGVLAPGFGEGVRVGQRLPSLAEFYGGSLAVHAEPGSRFVYNNHGPATLGQLVEDVTGLPLSLVFRQRILDPLGMADTDLLRSDRVRSGLATGYEIGSRGVRQVVERDAITAGAASLYSTPADMARYAAALLRGGGGDQAAILSPQGVKTMFAPHYQPDPRVPGMGLGFFRSEYRGQVTVGHQGTIPGFHSMLSLAPGEGVGVVAFTNGAHRADFWLPAAVARMLRPAGEDAAPDESAPAPLRPELWADLCGWYKLSARATDVRLRGMLGAGVEVFVRDGGLAARFLTPIPELARGFPLVPDDPADPYAFGIRLDDEWLDTIRVVFGQAASGRTDRLHLRDMMPLTLRKQPASANPRRVATGVAGVVALAAATVGVRAAARLARG
jgi:CubicO group peptidase (beta-lactamase class C family)